MITKTLSVLSAVYAVLLVVGAFYQGSPLRPLQGFFNQTPINTADAYISVESPDAIQTALAAAKRAQQPVVVDVWAQWCIACKDMEQKTLKNPQVIEKLRLYAKIRMDITQSNPSQTQWLQAQGLYGPPALLFYDAQGVEQINKRVVGEVSATQLLKVLQ